MVGPLAYLLKNRFYIGEVVYRGEVHAGEQIPIIDRELAVQRKLAERAVTRKLRRSRSPSFLCGLLFDDRGNRMSPSHANKKGVRYRYYVSQALLQKRNAEAGSIGRVAAPDVEELAVAALRHQVSGCAQVAQVITGTAWNGPRFFGLRAQNGSEAPTERAAVTKGPSRFSVRGSVRSVGGHSQGLEGRP
jgi:hypothetical protein